MNRTQIADLIINKLEMEKNAIKDSYNNSKDKIGFFVVDNLLPNVLVRRMYDCFPAPSSMKLKRSLREFKYISAQMNNYNALLEETIYAFQDKRIVESIAVACGIDSLYPDEHLYAGGISIMGDKQFLNPHLDNSHDKDRNKWRVFNLLFYVTENWNVEDGGNLELWPDGIGGKQITIHSKFNRLAVMATHQKSWHSVSPIHSDNYRCCISNYYFSDIPLKETDEFHVTSFRGRPNQKIIDLILRADIRLRMGIRKLFKKGIVENKHVYKK